MARQEFLSGGYRGKLGNTVGMRYRARYTVREYVIPRDPESPAQMSHRALFALASRLSVEARQINGNDGEWDTSRMTEYAARLKHAYAHLAAGETPEQAFPLHPDGWIPPFQIKLASAAVNAITQTAGAAFTQLDGFTGQWLELGFTARNSAGETTAAKTYPRTLISATPPLSYSLTFEAIDFGDADTVDFGAKVYATETGTEDLTALDGIYATYTPKPQPHLTIASAYVEANNMDVWVQLADFTTCWGYWSEFSFVCKDATGTVTVAKTLPRLSIYNGRSPMTLQKFDWLDFGETTTAEFTCKVYENETGGTVPLFSSTVTALYQPVPAPVLTMSQGNVNNATLKVQCQFSTMTWCRGRWLEISYEARKSNGDVVSSGTFPREVIGEPPLASYGGTIPATFGCNAVTSTVWAKIWSKQSGGSAPLVTATKIGDFTPLYSEDFIITTKNYTAINNGIVISVTCPPGGVGLDCYVYGTVEDINHDEIGEIEDPGYPNGLPMINYYVPFDTPHTDWRYVYGNIYIHDDDEVAMVEIDEYYIATR